MSSALDIALLAASWTHVLLAPYTKVEESFNLHATHDVLFYGVNSESLPKVGASSQAQGYSPYHILVRPLHLSRSSTEDLHRQCPTRVDLDAFSTSRSSFRFTGVQIRPSSCK